MKINDPASEPEHEASIDLDFLSEQDDSAADDREAAIKDPESEPEDFWFAPEDPDLPTDETSEVVLLEEVDLDDSGSEENRGDDSEVVLAEIVDDSQQAIDAEIIEEAAPPAPTIVLGSVLLHREAKRKRTRAILACVTLLLLVGGGLSGYFLAKRFAGRQADNRQVSQPTFAPRDQEEPKPRSIIEFETDQPPDSQPDPPRRFPASPFSNVIPQPDTGQEPENTPTFEDLASVEEPSTLTPAESFSSKLLGSAEVDHRPPDNIEFVRRLLNEVSSPPATKGKYVQLDRAANDRITAESRVAGVGDGRLFLIRLDDRAETPGNKPTPEVNHE